MEGDLTFDKIKTFLEDLLGDPDEIELNLDGDINSTGDKTKTVNYDYYYGDENYYLTVHFIDLIAERRWTEIIEIKLSTENEEITFCGKDEDGEYDEIYSTYPQYLFLLEVKVNGCKQQ